MKLALLSDTHDRKNMVEKIVEKFLTLGVTHILHTGDLISPWMLDLLQPERYPTWYVFGNNEEDHEGLIERANILGITLFLDVGEFTLDHRKIGCTHYPRVAESMAAFGSYDLIVYGHSHRKSLKHIKNKGWLVNPGTSGGERGPGSFAIYDTRDHEVQFFDVDAHQKTWHFE